MAQEIGNSNLLEVWATSGQVVEPDISKIEDGWQLGEQPPHEFMNWLQNTFGAKLNHILSNGAPEWNSTTSFTAGSLAKRTGNVWIAMQPNVNSEPSDGNVNWSRLLKLADIVNDLVSTDTDKALSAAQGKLLQDNKFEKADVVDNLTTDDATKALSAAQGKELQDSKLDAVGGSIDQLTASPNSQPVKNALNAGGDAPIYACRAWVNFNGVGTVAIRASGNVVGITDIGTGLFNINLTLPIEDENYSVVGSCINLGTSESVRVHNLSGYAIDSSTVRVQTNLTNSTSPANGLFDMDVVSVAVIR